jgi:hypothetical protein
MRERRITVKAVRDFTFDERLRRAGELFTLDPEDAEQLVESKLIEVIAQDDED